MQKTQRDTLVLLQGLGEKLM